LVTDYCAFENEFPLPNVYKGITFFDVEVFFQVEVDRGFFEVEVEQGFYFKVEQ